MLFNSFINSHLRMSTSQRNPQRHQQVFYQQRQQPIQQQRRADIGSSTLLESSHRGVGGEHQIVVVSGDNQNTNYVPSYHSANCQCPSCETKVESGHSSSIGNRHELYSYSLPANDDEDGIVREFLAETGERHVVIMTKNDASPQPHHPEVLSVQERIRRQKLSEAARNRYALLSEDEKRAVTERRIVMRQRRKQKEREMEELEAILRATNDITDDLVPIDEMSLQRKRAKISRYQSMSIDERREYNQKRRLRQLGLPDNINQVPTEKMEQIKEHIAEVNSRKAEAARQRYHRMSAEERKAYNRRRTESFRKRRVEEEKLLSTPAGQITPEALEKAQSIMLRNQKRAEQARMRYQKKQQEKGVMPRKQRKPKTEANTTDSGEPNLDQILDSIERDVVRKTEEARQALKRKQQIELKKEEPTHGHIEGEQFLTPTNTSDQPTTHIIQSPHPQHVGGQNVVQYVQVPSQNGFIVTDNKFVQVHAPNSAQPEYALIQEPPSGSKFEGTSGANYYPVSIIQHEPSHHHQHQTTSSRHQIGGSQPTRIEIVQPTLITTSHGNFEHLSAMPNTGGGHIIHYSTQQPNQPYTIQIEQQPLSHRPLASSRRIMVDPNLSPVDQKLILQKAKRAERARRRYHEMSVEARHEFNAKRAHALKMARLRDEELCRLGDEISVKGEEPDENLRIAIEQARLRRAKRAEAARIKYQKMTSDQRKAHNAMRDAQRRQRKREIEDTVTIIKQ